MSHQIEQQQNDHKSQSTENLFLFHKNGEKSKVVYRSNYYPSDWNKSLRKITGTKPEYALCGDKSSFVIFKNANSVNGQMSVVSNSKLRVKK